MKQIACLTLVVLVAACAPRQQCPWLGVDVNNPDFYQPVTPQTIDAVYGCEMNRTRDTYSQTDLKYQWNLWRRVALREITPGMAQQDWILFSNDHAYQQGQLDAARRASYRSYSGGGSRHYSKSRDRDRGRSHSGGSKPSSPAPSVPNIQLPSIPGIPHSSLTAPVTPEPPTQVVEVTPIPTLEPEPVVVAAPSAPAPEPSPEPAPAPSAPEPAPTPEPVSRPEPVAIESLVP